MRARVDHLRYFGVGVPNFEETVDFYGGIWGLKQVDGDKTSP